MHSSPPRITDTYSNVSSEPCDISVADAVGYHDAERVVGDNDGDSLGVSVGSSDFGDSDERLIDGNTVGFTVGALLGLAVETVLGSEVGYSTIDCHWRRYVSPFPLLPPNKYMVLPTRIGAAANVP